MPERGPTVAVVIPCYGYARFLPDAVASLRAQTRPPDEVLVVDDGSPDDTSAVATSLGVRVLRTRNGGLASARNTGARNVSSDLVVFLDADDELHPSYLARCVAAWEEAGPRTFVYTQWRETGTGSGVSSWPAFDVERLKEWNYVHASALLPRAAVLDHPYRGLRLGWEDWDFYLGLVEHGYRGVLVDEPLLLYRQHGASMIDRLYASDVKRRYALAVLALRHRRLYGARHVRRRWVAVVTGVVAAVWRRVRRVRGVAR